MIELNPCPNCHQELLNVYTNHLHTSRAYIGYVKCETCLLRGPKLCSKSSESEDQFVHRISLLWNKFTMPDDKKETCSTCKYLNSNYILASNCVGCAVTGAFSSHWVPKDSTAVNWWEHVK
jgi:ssDNA-binding Zn-finger/Zn-ribbon topoisomerase 1